MAVESIGIIGVGNVGQALLFGWLGTATLQASQFIITNGPEYSCDDVLRQAQALGFSGIKATSDVAEVIRNAQVVILSVKPYVLRDIMTSDVVQLLRGKIFLTTLAGVSFDDYAATCASLPTMPSFFGRLMPNVAARVGKGINVIIPVAKPVDQVKLLLTALFEPLGLLLWESSEALMDAYMAIGASSPAFFSLFCDAMADGAVHAGLPRHQALQIVAQSALGTAAMILAAIQDHGSSSKGGEATEFKNSVCTPAGCTIKGIQALEEGAVRGCIMRAVERAAETFSKKS